MPGMEILSLCQGVLLLGQFPGAVDVLSTDPAQFLTDFSEGIPMTPQPGNFRAPFSGQAHRTGRRFCHQRS